MSAVESFSEYRSIRAKSAFAPIAGVLKRHRLGVVASRQSSLHPEVVGCHGRETEAGIERDRWRVDGDGLQRQGSCTLLSRPGFKAAKHRVRAALPARFCTRRHAFHHGEVSIGDT